MRTLETGDMGGVIALALLLGGCALIVYKAGGFRAVGPEMLRLITRPRAAQTSLALFGGIVAAIARGVGLCRYAHWF